MEVEEQEVTVLASEEEVEVEDRRIFFRPCRWINCPFMCIRVLAGGTVAVETADLEAEDGCVPGGAVVGAEVGSVRVHRNCHILLVRRSGGDTVI